MGVVVSSCQMKLSHSFDPGRNYLKFYFTFNHILPSSVQERVATGDKMKLPAS